MTLLNYYHSPENKASNTNISQSKNEQMNSSINVSNTFILATPKNILTIMHMGIRRIFS